MPSSMIFASLVVLWLLILVPAIARHRQEVARPTVAALSGRVLERPRRRHGPDVDSELEVDVDEDVDQVDEGHPTATRTDHDDRDDPDDIDDRDDRDAGGSDDRDGDRPGEAYSDGRDDRLDDHQADHQADDYDADDYDGPESRDDDHEADDDPGVRGDDGWERPPPRYRPGRGGFDPEAAAVAAKARYAFRQRVVLSMLIVAILSGVIAAIAVPSAWWLHGAVDVLLIGYLIYLRRQVRLEEAIRERRASRMAGTRRPRAADDPDLDEWARRGREAGRRPADDRYDEDDYDDEGYEADGYDADHDDADHDHDDDHGRERRERVRGESSADAVEGEPALPRLRPAPPPPLPAGTALVEATEDDPELHDLAGPARRDYRHAVGE
ncbi:divisome protein SepX/GlpR [Pseudonocardia sp. CA-142604]|uniref:divisome protein SepX/GlpR n=1 Tax=Pseudonocardia sp. CA-142604 TaxID=3240024 RepID=UPI003D8F3631